MTDSRSQDGKCGVQYERHPTLAHLVAVCARPEGHDGEHSNVLPKTLPSLLGISTPPGECAECGGDGKDYHGDRDCLACGGTGVTVPPAKEADDA